MISWCGGLIYKINSTKNGRIAAQSVPYIYTSSGAPCWVGAPNNPQRTRQQHRKQMDLAYMYKKVAKHLPFFTSLFFREKISQVSGIHPHAADPPSCIGQREGTYGVSLYHPSNLVRPRSLRSFQEVSLYRPILTSRECPSVIRGSDSLGDSLSSIPG